MISLFARRLVFAGTRTSYAKVARATQIPYRRLLAMRGGGIKATASQAKKLANFYQREAYAYARATGVPVGSARRIAGYAPEHMQIKLLEVNKYVDDLSLYHVSSEIDDYPDLTTQQVIDLRFDMVKQNIIKAMRKSRRTIDDIIGHGLS